MIVGVPKETFPGERRVALTPAVIPLLVKKGITVVVESGAGVAAGYPDSAYREKGAQIGTSRADLFAAADVILQARALGANPEAGRADHDLLRKDQVLIALCDPLGAPEAFREPARLGVTVFSLELLPRITRAQSMDALSSMSTVAGYKAVLLAAAELPRMFPLLMTAAGTVSPARVFVVGAGVAGLTAIATARRLGAVVEAYDVRAAVKEQVESLGAKFVELPLEGGEAAEGAGGYARAMEEEFYRRQRELLSRTVAASDVVITTALVPGKKAPQLVTGEMVAGMAPGSVVVDLASEQGGNCELTRPGETVVAHGVTVLGPVNLPATVPYHASQMYSKNVSAFLLHLVREGRLAIDMQDEITRETLVARDGEILSPRVRAALGLPAAVPGAGSGAR
ncbi:MAG: Re/Si-specific NAD(P)(+) transhydrogenase subunit alpha [Candidatus Deferrimicrobiaceae bacterium]